jgi:hypothetical protein
LRLANQNDLEQLGPVRIDVRQHPEFFESLQVKILRLVNDEDRVPSPLIL